MQTAITRTSGAGRVLLVDDHPAVRRSQVRLSAAVTGPVIEDLRQLYEAAVSRSKELEAENADLSTSVARLEENVCATWSSSSSRPAPSWPTAARCCGPRR